MCISLLDGPKEKRCDEDRQGSEQEDEWQLRAGDYCLRFCGHCNTTTDIKEANFFGRYTYVDREKVNLLMYQKFLYRGESFLNFIKLYLFTLQKSQILKEWELQ